MSFSYPTVPMTALVDLLKWFDWNSNPKLLLAYIRGLPDGSEPVWKTGIIDARLRKDRTSVEVDVFKPGRRRTTTEAEYSTFIMDPEGLALALLFVVAGGTVMVDSSRGQGGTVFHYLCISLPGAVPLRLHRLVADLPADRHVMLRDHHDLRRSALSGSQTIAEARDKIGKQLVSNSDAITRQIATSTARECLSQSWMRLVMGTERYVDYLERAYELLDELPLGG